MTEQEAIRRIEEHKKIHFKEEYPHAFLIIEALDMAIEALKKQDSQEVEKTVAHWDGYKYECPVCEGDLYEKQSFCDECGQKISWEDSK